MESISDREKDELIAQFCAVGGEKADAARARSVLESTSWNLEEALALFFESDDSLPTQSTDTNVTATSPDLQAASESAGHPTTRQAHSGPHTLRDFQGEGHSRDESDGGDDDDMEDENEQDFFAGGEKSGLAVQNPGNNARDHVSNILKRARRNLPRPGGEDDEQPRTNFSGTGHTLGGDDTPSQAIPDPNTRAPKPAPRVHRELHLWRDGFSVEDGPLYRYDDPANAAWLAMIHRGQAPLALLNVEQGQQVDVEIRPHKDEDYVQPKRKYKPFQGQGQRLGSPAPAISGVGSSAASSSAAAAAASSSSQAPPARQVDVNDSQPTISLQIRLGDGTRLQSRFNTTHTIGDVYSFVNSASPASLQRQYVLMTTFPSKDLEDHGAVLGELAEFKRGGVVVQKWK